ncbi:alpha/beta hydrolase [Adhaeribacter aquaticus]|uniref:alpha/beta hydrolase n=1 Tax=Adhaeribacter aquaticus TaxID=299567 RepID=UPI00047A904D|nr:alpha/beta hydrolase [Adhaeribacter aquaticus]
MKKLLLFSIISFLTISMVYSQQNAREIPLYEGKIPNEVPGPDEEKGEMSGDIYVVRKVRKPTLTVYLPAKEKANGTAVVILPGGGYGIVASRHEGVDVAKKFNEQGIAAFVVKYRLPDAKVTSNPEITPLQDAQQALTIVRKRAKEWDINPARVGIMGFSAGGHLASTVGTHFNNVVAPAAGKVSVRPDFMLLIYPVISGDPAIAHQGSFNNLLGKGASVEKIKEYSNEQQVTAQTPPTFLLHASDDNVVKSANSIVFYQALMQNKVPAELHIYQNGGHGFGLNNKTTQDYWFDRCTNWLSSNGLLKAN